MHQVELSHPDAELRLLEVFYHKIYKVTGFILVFASYSISLFVGTELVYAEQIKGGVVVTVTILFYNNSHHY